MCTSLNPAFYVFIAVIIRDILKSYPESVSQFDLGKFTLCSEISAQIGSEIVLVNLALIQSS